MPAPLIIAIDGPAASGKGVIARALAEHFGFAHLDTGLLYRAVAWELRDTPHPSPTQAEQAARRLRESGIADLPQRESLLRREDISLLASQVAQLPAVRAQLRALQREFAEHPPGNAPGAVIEGRDIATVICPDAPVKLYVQAGLEARARRRLLDAQRAAEADDTAPAPSLAAIRADLQTRDTRDTTRSTAPLRRADSALLLDNSKLSIQESIVRSIEMCEAQMRAARASHPSKAATTAQQRGKQQT